VPNASQITNGFLVLNKNDVITIYVKPSSGIKDHPGGSTMEKYICPICGFDELEEKPYINGGGSHEICPSCGFQFEYSEYEDVDFGDVDSGDGPMPDNILKKAFQLYRKAWIENGAALFSPEVFSKECQENGSLKKEKVKEQLENINISIKQV
jgi:predicted RNA-binding Zn-ribbon protein involved in translation (DUF1610 family)